MSTEILDVWVNNRRVGELIQDNYEYLFQYQNIAELNPERDLVSLTMPVRIKPYDTQVLMPPFQMSLPEGALLENLNTRFGKIMDVTNNMVLLRLIGNNPIGKVRFTAPGQALQTAADTRQYTLQDLLTYPETGELFKELLEQLALQSGISGVQPKVLWSEHGRKVALLSGQYILKSAGRDYPGLAINEFFCLEAARASGLNVPDYYLAESGEMLIIKRFDIETHKQLAFEEACALLNLPSSGKYTGSYENVADLFGRVPCEPVFESKRHLFKVILLSIALKNGDAHLKNFGILYDDISNKWLAPVYDLVTTTIYLPKDLPALSLGGRKQWPDLEAMKHFGLHACGLRTRDLNVCIDDVRSGIEYMKQLIKAYTATRSSLDWLRDSMLSVVDAVDW